MAISKRIPPLQNSVDSQQSSASSHQSGSPTGTACLSDADSSIPTPVGNLCEVDDSQESVAMAFSRIKAGERCMPRASPTPACLRVSQSHCKSRGGGHDASLRESLAHLRQQLASLQSILPPGLPRSASASSVIVEALKYKKALDKQLWILQSALPCSRQVNVERLGGAGVQIRVSCNKEPGLLVALMEALESFGLCLTNVNISCLNNNIKIHAISTEGSLAERRGSLKVVLMATIMQFAAKGR